MLERRSEHLALAVALLTVVACARPDGATPSAPTAQPKVVVSLPAPSGAPLEERDRADEPPRPDPPATASASPAAAAVLEIQVDARATVRVAGVRVASDAELVSRVRAVLARNGRHDGLIRAHPSVAYAEVVRVMDLARQGGLTEVTFAVLP